MAQPSESALLELGLGALCLAIAVGLLQEAAELAAPPLPAAARTPDPSAPPPALGPAYDSDAALPARAEEVASYRLEARLDATTHTVRAKGTIVWKNAASVAANEIWLHLYLNAFKNERSLFLRSPFGAGRSGARATDWGFTDVERLVARELGGVDLWPGAARHSPDDPDDHTDIRVPLPKPVEPGATLTLDVEFSSKLPAIVERTGYSGDFHFVGQWYPKLARREPDGTWAHFAFHPQSEFFADFGRYDVTLDVPDSMRVGATGVRVEERRAGGRLVVRQVAENVHDFAWTAWAGFRERSERIESTDVRFMHPPGHDANLELTIAAIRFALPRLNRLYGRYPHPILTVVHPPDHAQNAAGMEYPMLITTGGPWYTAYSRVRGIEGVTVHELGHQWFQGLLGSNEHAWPFLDEGLTTYVEETTLDAMYGRASLIQWPGLALSYGAARRALAVAHGHDEVVALPAAAFPSFEAIGMLVYARTSTILGTLGNVYGRARLQRALGRYARRYRFQHPTPKHFVAAVRELAGEEAAQNLERALFERGWVDYVAESLQTAPVRAPAGVFDGPAGRETKTPETERATEWESRVLVLRHGTLTFPVDVELWLESGERVRKRWDGRGSSASITHRASSRVVAALIDPDRRISLDENLSNNAVRSEPSGVPRVWERALYAAELVLGGVVP